MKNKRGVGIVLAGGGAKGGYEVGVWRAICELGLTHLITGFSGTSIGAINTLLFALGDWRLAEDIWLEMSEPGKRRIIYEEILPSVDSGVSATSIKNIK